MAFPFVFEASFEQGNNSEFDSETDTGSLLDFPHYSRLAVEPESTQTPYRGAYCMRVNGMGDTNDHTVTEGDLNVATDTRSYFRFYLNLPRLSVTAADTWNVFELQNTNNTVRMAIGLRAGTSGTGATRFYDIGIGATAPSVWATTYGMQTNRWYCLELEVHPNTTTGAATLYIDGSLAATVNDLNGADGAQAIGQGVLGTQNTLSTTTGVVLFDEFVQDDARLYPIMDRFPDTVLLTKSGHVFVGPGIIDNISLLSGAGTDCVLTVYDTDRGNSNDASKIVTELKNISNNELVDPAGMPAEVRRGCYVVLSGTNPRALVKIRRASNYSPQGYKNLGQKTSPNPLEVL